MEIKQYIKENEARFMEELFSLIRIPSISALPEHKDDMLACALRLSLIHISSSWPYLFPCNRKKLSRKTKVTIACNMHLSYNS